MFATANPSCGGSTVRGKSPTTSQGCLIAVNPIQDLAANARRTGVNHAARERRAGVPISSAKPTIRTTSFESSSRDRSPFQVQPLFAAIVVHDAELDR